MCRKTQQKYWKFTLRVMLRVAVLVPFKIKYLKQNLKPTQKIYILFIKHQTTDALWTGCNAFLLHFRNLMMELKHSPACCHHSVFYRIAYGVLVFINHLERFDLK